MSYAKRSFLPKTEVRTGSASLAIEDSKKKSSLLKDNSWIRRDAEEDEPVDRDPNFGRAVLSRLKPSDYPDGKSPDSETPSTVSTSTRTVSSTSVQSISKRFDGTDEAVKSPPPPSYDKALATKRSPITTRPSKTETFTERVFSDVKSSNKPKPSAPPPKPSKTNDDTEGTSRRGTWSVSSPKTSETTTVKTFTETVKNEDYSKAYSPSSPSSFTTTTRTKSVSSPKLSEATTVKNEDYSKAYSPSSPSSFTTTTRTRSVSSPKPFEATSVKSFTETVSDKPLDSLADDLISLSSTSLPSTRDRDYSKAYSPSSPSSFTTTRTRSVSSPKTFEATSVKSFTETVSDKPLDSLADDLISLSSTSLSSTRDRDYSKTYTTTPNSTTTLTTRSSSVYSPKPEETSFTDTARNDSLDALSDTFTSNLSPSLDRDYSRTYSSSPTSSTTITTRTRSVSSPKPSEATTVTSYTESVRNNDDSRTYSTNSSTTPTTRSMRTYSSGEYSPSVKTSSVNSEPSFSYGDGTYTRHSYSSLPRDSTSYEYSNLSSPSSYTKTSYVESSPSDSFSETRSSNTVNSSSDSRAITAKDICTYCHKPMSIEAKMILDDLQIHCHASCFKCEVCGGSLGHLKAGDTMWIYRRTVHCERCFETTREKWHR